MPAIAQISLNDGLATPVAHIFAPAKTQSDYALLEDRSAGVYLGYNKLTYSLTRPTGPSGANRNLKLSIKIETPKMEVLSGSDAGYTPAPTVAYRPVAELIVTLPERCTLQDRKDLKAFLSNVMVSSFTTQAFEAYELPY